MLKDALFIARKDVRYMLSARETIVWVFVMPIVFFFFIGKITGGIAPSTSGSERLAVRAGENAGFLADQFERRLTEREYTIEHPQNDSLFVRYSRRLTIPANFTDSVLVGSPTKILFERAAGGVGFDYDSIRIRRAAYTVLADIIVTSKLHGAPTRESIEELNAVPRALTIDVKPAGRRRTIPSGFQQAIPGIMVMFTLLVMVTSGAILLVTERRQGLLRRLAYTPITRLGVTVGKWGGKLALGLIQIGFAMLAGTILFKMDWGPNLGVVIAVMTAYGALMASIGMLLGSIARTEGQAAAIGVISANILAALGGCWWPIEVTPAWMQKLQLFLPTGWAMDALHKIISFEAPPLDVAVHIVGMALAAFVLLAVSSRVFRFD
jgi:ABC-type multidrug transport system permease subunit